MSGVPCIRGTGIPVSVIVGRIAEGRSTEEIVAEYPQVAPEDVAAAAEFATAAVDLRELPLGTVKSGALQEPRPGSEVGSLGVPQVGPVMGAPRALPAASPQVANGGRRRGRVRGRDGKSDAQPGERVEVLSSELVVVPDSVATELRIPRGGWAIRRRQLKVNGTGPVELSTSWYDGRLADRAPRLLEPANVREGTMAYLQKVTSHRAAQAHNVITVRHASAEEKRLLRLAGGRPPVVITRHLVADADGAPIEFVETVQAPERWAVTVPEPTEADQSSIPASPPSGRRPAGIVSRLRPKREQPLDHVQPSEQVQPREQARRPDQGQPLSPGQPGNQALPDAVRHLAALPTALPGAMSASRRGWPVAKEWLGDHGPWLVVCVLTLILIAALGVLVTAPYVWNWGVTGGIGTSFG